MFSIDVEVPADAPVIESLLDRAFGPDRIHKVSYRYRDGVSHQADLARVARASGAVVGTIRYWPIVVGTSPALLLGPLGVVPELRGLGIGRALLHATLTLPAVRPRPVLLVGDAAYYAPFGFVPSGGRVAMPGERPERIMALGPLTGVPEGVVRPVRTTAVDGAATAPSREGVPRALSA